MFQSSRAPLLLGVIGSNALNKRPTKIIIPNLPSSSNNATKTNLKGAFSHFDRNGALNSERYKASLSSSASPETARSNSGRKKLFVDTPYVSEGSEDRWSGQGPLHLRQEGKRGPYRATPVAEVAGGNVNDMESFYGKVRNDPSQDQLSPGEDLAKVLGGSEAGFVRQRRERQRFLNAVDEQHESVWRDSKAHLRALERSMEMHGGIEGAISNRLAPKTPSAQSEITSRPLDKRILEEIYKDLHGRRSEQALKKNLSYERWVAKADSNAPVMAASRKAQETFGFGGTAQVVKRATVREQFPITPLPEVAFIGRTNSGRSSLINALLNSYVCKYGHLKGTTTTADFVNVADKLMIVDLPGYGNFHVFSADPLRVKQGQTINEAYLAACSSADTPNQNAGPTRGTHSVTNNGRQRNTKRVFVCVPSVTGLQDGDISLCDLLEQRAIPFSVLLTKTDLVAIRTLAKMADLTRSKIAKYTHCEELMLVNSLRLAGISRIQNLLGNIARKEALNVDPLQTSFDTIV